MELWSGGNIIAEKIVKAKGVKKTKTKAFENRIAISVLAYMLIGIIWYLVDEEAKKDEYTKFHVKQGIVLLIASIIYSIILGIIMTILGSIFILIPGAGLVLFTILGILYYVPLIFCIIGIITAATDKQKELPIIGWFGNKFNI